MNKQELWKNAKKIKSSPVCHMVFLRQFRSLADGARGFL